MQYIQCPRCRRQLLDDAVACPHCDAPIGAAPTPADEGPSPWERTIPLALLVAGLLVLVAHGFAVAGPGGGLGVLVRTSLVLAVYLPLTIAAMFIAARILEINFGAFGPAVLKIAGIYLFAWALHDVGATVGHPILGWVVGLGLSLYLYGKAFGLNATELVGVVLVVAVVRVVLGMALASFVAAVERT